MKIKPNETAWVDIHQVKIENINKFNSTLFDVIQQKAIRKDGGRVKGAWMTEWEMQLDDDFRDITEYVLNYIPNLDTRPVELVELWGQIYNIGDYQQAHHHKPRNLSFVYYVNTPKGSAPLMFEDIDKNIPPQAGDLVIFPSWVKHYVPENNCKGRAIVAGNLKYKN
tara:strand:+ start:240 stop:740 length:501 start_codon:yes stop_codon:yes gene_type:complete